MSPDTPPPQSVKTTAQKLDDKFWMQWQGTDTAQGRVLAEVAALREALEVIKNLAHLAWTDEVNIRTSFEMIGEWCRRALVAQQPAESKHHHHGADRDGCPGCAEGEREEKP